MFIECEVELTTLDGDHGPVESVEATCSRCDNRTEAFGVEERSIRRCLAQMRETCPKGERNVYVDAGSGTQPKVVATPTPVGPGLPPIDAGCPPLASIRTSARTRRIEMVSETRLELWRKANASPADVQAAFVECYEMTAPQFTKPDEVRTIAIPTGPSTADQRTEWWYGIGLGIFAVVSIERDVTIMETVHRVVASIDCGGD